MFPSNSNVVMGQPAPALQPRAFKQCNPYSKRACTAYNQAVASARAAANKVPVLPESVFHLVMTGSGQAADPLTVRRSLCAATLQNKRRIPGPALPRRHTVLQHADYRRNWTASTPQHAAWTARQPCAEFILQTWFKLQPATDMLLQVTAER